TSKLPDLSSKYPHGSSAGIVGILATACRKTTVTLHDRFPVECGKPVSGEAAPHARTPLFRNAARPAPSQDGPRSGVASRDYSAAAASASSRTGTSDSLPRSSIFEISTWIF